MQLHFLNRKSDEKCVRQRNFTIGTPSTVPQLAQILIYVIKKILYLFHKFFHHLYSFISGKSKNRIKYSEF